MHKSMRNVFAEHDAPKYARRTEVIAANRPIANLVAKIQAQAAAYRAELVDAENDPDLPEDFRGKLELLNRELETMERVVGEAIRALRELTRMQVQFDRVMIDAKKDLEAWELRSENRVQNK